MNNSFEELQNYCKGINEEKSKLEETVSYMEAEKVELKMQHQDLFKELEQVREELQTSREQCKSLQERVDSFTSNDGSADSKNQLLKEITMVEEELDKMTKESI